MPTTRRLGTALGRLAILGAFFTAVMVPACATGLSTNQALAALCVSLALFRTLSRFEPPGVRIADAAVDQRAIRKRIAWRQLPSSRRRKRSCCHASRRR